LSVSSAIRYVRALGRMKLTILEKDAHGTVISTSTVTCSTPTGLWLLARLYVRVTWLNFKIWRRQKSGS
jgi:hypothetical protein